MYVEYMVRDDAEHQGPEVYTRIPTFRPSWPEVEQALLALDGERRTYVMLAPSEEEADAFTMLARLEDGALICSFYDGHEYYLTKPTGKPPDRGTDSPAYVLDPGDLNMLLKAAKSYFETGKRESQLAWMRT